MNGTDILLDLLAKVTKALCQQSTI